GCDPHLGVTADALGLGERLPGVEVELAVAQPEPHRAGDRLPALSVGDHHAVPATAEVVEPAGGSLVCSSRRPGAARPVEEPVLGPREPLNPGHPTSPLWCSIRRTTISTPPPSHEVHTLSDRKRHRRPAASR